MHSTMQLILRIVCPFLTIKKEKADLTLPFPFNNSNSAN